MKLSIMWWLTIFDAYCEGRAANSLYENPYWKNYPKESTFEEESKAMFWIDGYANQYSFLETGYEAIA